MSGRGGISWWRKTDYKRTNTDTFHGPQGPGRRSSRARGSRLMFRLSGPGQALKGQRLRSRIRAGVGSGLGGLRGILLPLLYRDT